MALGGAAMLAWIVLDHLPRNGGDARAPAADLPVKSQAVAVAVAPAARRESSSGGKAGVTATSNVNAAAAAHVAEATRLTRDERHKHQLALRFQQPRRRKYGACGHAGPRTDIPRIDAARRRTRQHTSRRPPPYVSAARPRRGQNPPEACRFSRLSRFSHAKAPFRKHCDRASCPADAVDSRRLLTARTVADRKWRIRVYRDVCANAWRRHRPGATSGEQHRYGQHGVDGAYVATARDRSARALLEITVRARRQVMSASRRHSTR